MESDWDQEAVIFLAVNSWACDCTSGWALVKLNKCKYPYRFTLYPNIKDCLKLRHIIKDNIYNLYRSYVPVTIHTHMCFTLFLNIVFLIYLILF